MCISVIQLFKDFKIIVQINKAVTVLNTQIFVKITSKTQSHVISVTFKTQLPDGFSQYKADIVEVNILGPCQGNQRSGSIQDVVMRTFL